MQCLELSGGASPVYSASGEILKNTRKSKEKNIPRKVNCTAEVGRGELKQLKFRVQSKTKNSLKLTIEQQMYRTECEQKF